MVWRWEAAAPLRGLRRPEEEEEESHLKAEGVAFLGAHVQRRATPEVMSVDVGPLTQEVPHDQVVVGRHGDLESCLHAHARTHTRSRLHVLNTTARLIVPGRCALSSRARRVQPFWAPARRRGRVCPERRRCEEPCKSKAGQDETQPTWLLLARYRELQVAMAIQTMVPPGVATPPCTFTFDSLTFKLLLPLFSSLAFF